MVDIEWLEQEAERFDALGHPIRLYLLHLIIKQEGSAHVDRLTDMVASYRVMSQPTISHHLKILSHAGFIREKRDGLKVYYHVRPEALVYCQNALEMIWQSGATEREVLAS